MTTTDSPRIAEVEGERTFSAQEAAALLGRSYSWLDQRVRADEFIKPDGTTVQPLRTPGGFRRFTQPMLIDMAASCYRMRWFSRDTLKQALTRMLEATGELPL